LPLDHPLLARDDSRITEQVHVTGGHPDEVFVTWLTNQSSPSEVSLKGDCTGCAAASPQTYQGSASTYSFLMNPRFELPCTSYNYTDPECYYTSGLVHTVHIQGLSPSTTYTYQVSGDALSYSFTTPPAVGAQTIKFGVVADLGQTANSTETLDGLGKGVTDKLIDAILFAGDLSYADGYGPRWDSYGRVGEKLWSRVPTAYVGGNHEVASGMENWQSYEARYPNHHERSGSSSMLWSSFETGPAHVVQLCSYAAFDATSTQYKWLQEDLAAVDRKKTPWLVVMMHTPWYTSNAHHPMSEGTPMREAMEELFHSHQVDVVFNGHVHAYERTYPVYQEKVNCASGITYITIGDGGNREMFATPWVPTQPVWSALREYAYGHGRFSVANATHAQWQWLRNPDAWNPNPGQVVGDEVWVTRGTARVAQGCEL